MTIPSLKEIKNWSPEIENQITEMWKNSEQFNVSEKTNKKIYSIDTPPPYINSPIHMGHAVTYCYMDFFARYKRMKGFDVIFPLGLDRNGLPIEMGAEKKYNISAFKMSREEFLSYCEKLLKETSAESIDSFAKLGISFTSYKKSNDLGAIYHTDSPEYRALTQSTFIELYKKGLIYEDARINNWDSKLQTTVADAEIDYKEIPSTFNYVKWRIKETKEEIIVATTRPELICTCGMLIFHPSDEKYKHLENKHAISPIFNQEIIIKPHPFANPEKGSGIVMMCAGGDLTDNQFFREQKLKPKIAINVYGKMNEIAGPLNDLKVKEAREKIISLLKEKNLLLKQEQIMHRTPISERSGAEIEFIEMPELYLKQLQFLKELKKISKEINFYPKESKKILDSWIDSVSIDWPISRRRFYATPIPLWHSGDLIAVPFPGKYYQSWKESPPPDAEIFKNNKSTDKKVKDFKDKKWTGEIRVLDTWFDSSISELFILKYKSNHEFFKKAYPATLRPQGKEIVRTWLYYTLLRGMLETNSACFKDCWIHQHVLDEKGKKMSKSLGNVTDPKEILKDFGAEALRLWSAEEGDISKQDLKISKEKIQSELKTINKLVNVSKFISLFKKPSKKPKITLLDQLFIDHLENLTEEIDKQYNSYNFYIPAGELRKFLWDILASNYLEIIKARAYNQENKFSKEEQLSAHYTLHFILERFITLIYPIIPQVTSILASNSNINILTAEFPKAQKTTTNLKLIEKIMHFNSEIWKIKKERGLTLKDSISEIKIPSDLKPFEKDLIACHNLVK